jgi:hypothetical protein
VRKIGEELITGSNARRICGEFERFEKVLKEKRGKL